ncbi:MAG TPA: NADH-quinone oxidoreductase subunit L [Candidatus Tyrphobacter sp.]
MMLLLALLIPLAGAVACWAFGPWLRSLAGWLATAAVGISFVVTLLLWSAAMQPGGAHATLFSWMSGFDFGLALDPLSLLWALIITGVGFLIHLYSIGYMHGDRAFARFFAYMNFFIFAMMLLVLSDNWIGLLVGWGLVGLASYFLIGFWFERRSAVAAARKAFVLNVVGDVGIMFAIFLIVANVHSIRFGDTFAASATFGAPLLYAICVGLFIGAAAKSAQIPLHTWLPDAMEGPTPVSALIHAATMVTAGVYLVARCAPLWNHSPGAQMLVGTIGALTALLGAILGMAQWDIKRILAYSTVSQIGYMIMGVGVGAYAGGVAHFFTHAFFKAQLFLASGLIIHALHNEQDVRKMGGLAARMPLAFWAILTGVLAICGIPGFSGFFSKDQVIQGALESGHPWMYGVGLLTAGITAYYMFRLFFITFLGEYRGNVDPAQLGMAWEPANAGGAHEPAPPSAGLGQAQGSGQAHAPVWVMGLPVALLVVPSVLAGWLLFPLDGTSPWSHFFAAQFPVHAASGQTVPEWVTALIALGVVLIGIGVAAARYATTTAQAGAVARLRDESLRMPKVLANAFYVDAFLDLLFVRGARLLGSIFGRVIDPHVIDGAVQGVAALSTWLGALVRALQSGLVRAYALIIVVGVGCFLAYYVLGIAH